MKNDLIKLYNILVTLSIILVISLSSCSPIDPHTAIVDNGGIKTLVDYVPLDVYSEGDTIIVYNYNNAVHYKRDQSMTPIVKIVQRDTAKVVYIDPLKVRYLSHKPLK